MAVLHDLVQRVAATIRRHRMASPGDGIGVAVSGGADSVCLLSVLRELRLGPLTVLHLDHQLRGAESRRDAEFVGELAARLGLPIVSRRAGLAHGNLEEEGRRARLDFFREVVRSGEVARVATGHTRSDQAETVLFRLLRGAAGDGLAGVRPVTSDGLIRPLLDVDRAEVEHYLQERGIAWRVDSTNSSARFARNRIRHDLLPLLARDWNPEIVSTLARTADWAAAEGDYWRGELDRLEPELLRLEAGAVLVPADRLSTLPPAVARRLVRRAIERAKGDTRGVAFDHVDAVVRLAGAERGNGTVELPRVRAVRSQNWLRFESSADCQCAGNYRIPAAVPGFIPIPGGSTAVRLELIENSMGSATAGSVYNGKMDCVDWDRLSGSLELRNWMPGDRFQPAESAEEKKLKTLFQFARIPKWERRQWPVLADGDSIIWTRRFGVSASFAAGPQTRSVLRVSEMAAE